MMDIMIKPKVLQGEISVPSSKSLCHRALISSSLAEGNSKISKVGFSKDIDATIGALRTLGVNIKEDRFLGEISVEGSGKINPISNKINCFESGSTLRFLIPLACTTGINITFTGQGKLVERPLQEYYKIFEKQSVNYSTNHGKLPLTVNGKISHGEYKVRGDVSSQFITGLLFALPILKGNSSIILTTPLESKAYVDLTIDMLKKFKIKIDNRDYKKFFIKGNQRYEKSQYKVEGDFSQGAFWIIAGILGSNLWCCGMNTDSLQGDKAILKIIEKMEGKISIDGKKIRGEKSSTKSEIIDVSQCPDLVPIIAVLAALSQGTTEIINAGRLRFKESDRLKAIATELNKIGGIVEEKGQGLIIKGTKFFTGGIVESWNDHRIAMAMAIASIKCKNPLIIKNADCVNKSYPNFWKDFMKVGGEFVEWHMGK